MSHTLWLSVLYPFYFSSLGRSSLILLRNSDLSSKSDSATHSASSSETYFQVTKNSWVTLLPTLIFLHFSSLSTSYKGAVVISTSGSGSSTGQLHCVSRQGFSNDTWKTGCIVHPAGNCNLYVTLLIFWITLNGPTYLLCSLVGHCRNRICLVLSSTKSPSWNSSVLRALDVCCIICSLALLNWWTAAWNSDCNRDVNWTTASFLVSSGECNN